jgi:hypothetical protein
LRAVAIRAAAGFNLRVQQTGSDNFAERLFTPFRFGVLLALLIVAAFPTVTIGVSYSFPPIFDLQTFVVRDFGFFSYPNAFFQRECFWRGELPFWDPYNNCGTPFLAQWNTMPLYPPSLIYLTLPLQWSLSFFCLLHLWFAGLGMFFLARRWTGSNFAAAFAATVFSFNGLTLNLLMWPSHIATFSWMPWVVLAVESAWREGGRKIFLAAIVGAMQMLAGGPETIFLTWLFLLALWLRELLKNETPRAIVLWRFPIVVLLVAALAAAQLLPFLDLAAHSERQAGYADMRWSMPAWGWANFLVPMVFGDTWNMGVFFQYDQLWTSSYYFGIGALWLALLAICHTRRPRVFLLSAAAILALVLALGENTFVYPALRKIFPLLSFVTYPVKYVLILTFLAPLLAAFGLAEILKNKNSARRIIFIGSILLALIGGILFWATRFSLPDDDVRATLCNGISRAFFLLVVGALLLVLTRAVKPGLSRIAPLILILVAWFDVFTHEPTQNPTAPPSVYAPGLAREKLAMNPQPELGQSRAMPSAPAVFRFVHHAISQPKNNFIVARLGYDADCNLLDAVPKVDGFFSLMPRECDAFQSLIYGTTSADFPKLEDFMGVSQITATNDIYRWQARSNFLPLVTAGQKPVFLDDANILHALAQNDFDGSKIVLLPAKMKSSVTISNQTSARVLNSKFGTQTVDAEVEADAPSLVVVSQTYYHDWRAYVDGQPTVLLRANYAFQAVQVSAGRHRIKLVYQDRTFKVGAAISLATLLVGGIFFATSARQKKTRC